MEAQRKIELPPGRGIGARQEWGLRADDRRASSGLRIHELPLQIMLSLDGFSKIVGVRKIERQPK
jgi:hypothetical protein